MFRLQSGLLLFVFTALLSTACSYRFHETSCPLPLPGRLVSQVALDSLVNEPSGLLFVDGLVWTLNDSGGESELYGLDPSTGKVERVVRVTDVPNHDWESLAMDRDFVYVADVGNNYADRDTVCIHRIPLPALREGGEVQSMGSICFCYEEDVVKTGKGLSSLDCEALLAFGDSLYLFTKNWVDESTSVYTLPKIPGLRSISAQYSYDLRMLLTGADLHEDLSMVALVGYSSYQPVIITYTFEDLPSRIHCGGKARIYPLKAGTQVEGICFDRDGNLLVSSEGTFWRQKLFKVDSFGR